MSSWPGHGFHGPAQARFQYMQPMPDPRSYSVYPPVQPAQGLGWYTYSPNSDPYRLGLTSPAAATHQHSSKYPRCNPVLAVDTSLLRIDARVHPASSIVPAIYHRHHGEPALIHKPKKVVLISHDLPWQIDIVSPATDITCENIWMSLYDALQQPIVDSEWGFIIREEGAKERIESAMRHRLENESKNSIEKGPKRIDFLGHKTIFRGLEKDEKYAKLRKMPFTRECEETWVVRFSA